MNAPVFSHSADMKHTPVILGGKTPPPVFIAPPPVVDCNCDCEDD